MTSIIADVKVTDALDAVVITPRGPGASIGLGSALRELGAAARRRGDGFAVAGETAASLLDGLQGFELRFTEDARRYATNRMALTERLAELRAAIRQIEAAPVDALVRRLPARVDVDRLDEHQVVNVAALSDRACFGLCLFDEQGAGKTVSAIFAWDVLADRDEVDFALIVAPKSMVPEWRRDLERFCGSLYSVGIASGARAAKLHALRSAPDVLVTNFETVISLEHELTAHLRAFDGRAVLIVDESFFVKNKDARRTRALRRLREWCGRAFVLCGTPAPNSALDVVEQIALADFGATFAGIALPNDSKGAHDVVNATLRDRGVYLRNLKRDVLPDLPGKAFDLVRLPLASDQQRLYDAAARDLILDLRRVDDEEFARHLGSYMARRAALLQICSNPVRVAPGYAETPAKLVALDAILQDLVSRKAEKVVVWSSYRASLDEIASRYRELGVVRFDGSIADVAARREAVRLFQENAETRLFVGNPAAAGAGLTLHAARYAIYESLTNQAAHYLQSLDRIHRRGQERDVRYIVLLAEGTIEEPDFVRLQRKEVAAQELLGDVVDAPPTREAMLTELVEYGPLRGDSTAAS